VISLDSFDWIDVTRPISEQTPVWPGDRAIVITQEQIDEMTISSFACTCHAGTHLDAPFHFDPDGESIEKIPIQKLVGDVEVVSLAPDPPRAIRVEDLPGGWRPSTKRVFVRTDSFPVGNPIDERFSGLAVEVVDLLADHGVTVLGLDTPSADRFEDAKVPVHRRLLAREMICIEGLDLSQVEAGLYHLIALPLRLVGVEGSPMRVVLARKESK
jgi:arylformamidase